MRPLYVAALAVLATHFEGDGPSHYSQSEIEAAHTTIRSALEIQQFLAFSIKQQTCKHKTEQESHEAECFICSTLDCPTACELHYHHDGCADCDGPS